MKGEDVEKNESAKNTIHDLYGEIALNLPPFTISLRSRSRSALAPFTISLQSYSPRYISLQHGLDPLAVVILCWNLMLSSVSSPIAAENPDTHFKYIEAEAGKDEQIKET
ncbi:hypothetical protein QL285_083733 [Trifolium repens]|nr:hypothetical protein QL285_083733 [Trifolium repens]